MHVNTRADNMYTQIAIIEKITKDKDNASHIKTDQERTGPVTQEVH